MGDEVTNYLLTAGYKPEPSYFSGSDYLTGMMIKTEYFRLIYRLEDGRLILCDFESIGESANAVQRLKTLLNKISVAVSQVRSIDALILESNDPRINRIRQRLTLFMRAQGAKSVPFQGEEWLRLAIR